MSDEYESYAVYWVPRRPDSLARFGTSWTGWCAERGEFRPREPGSLMGEDARAIAHETCRHGFHGVIRAPFRLLPERSQFTLEHALELLSEQCLGFALPRMRLAVVGGRVALVPREGSTALGALVASTAAAVANLAEGAVMAEPPVPCTRNGRGQVVQLPAAEAHRFHAPLTDPMPLAAAFEVVERLRPVLEPSLDEPRRLTELALMGDPGEGRPLRLLQRYELRETPVRRATVALPCQGPHILAPLFDQTMVERDIAI